jgi:hypothetical protein
MEQNIEFEQFLNLKKNSKLNKKRKLEKQILKKNDFLI